MISRLLKVTEGKMESEEESCVIAPNPMRSMDEDYVDEASSEGTYGNKSLEELILQSWTDGQNTDVVFKVQCKDGWRQYPANKLVLALWSAQFADRLYSSEQADDTIEISDVSPRSIETTLRFMYEGETSLQAEVKDVRFILEVYHVAVKFEIASLREYCRRVFNNSSPNTYNVFDLLEAGKLIGSKTLQKMCYKVLQSQTTKVLATRELENVTLPMMRTILEMPRISCLSEYELATWVFSWVKNQFLLHSNERPFKSILDDVLPYLRLTSMRAEEFGALVENYKSSNNDIWISDADGFSIFMNIVRPGSWPLPEWYNPTDVDRSYSLIL